MNRQDAEDAKLPEPDLELDRVARIVVDAALQVHRVLGPGFLESVYEQALAVELSLRGVSFAAQVPIALAYEGAPVDLAFLGALAVRSSVSSGFVQSGPRRTQHVRMRQR